MREREIEIGRETDRQGERGGVREGGREGGRAGEYFFSCHLASSPSQHCHISGVVFICS